jgi:hypothetical protein
MTCQIRHGAAGALSVEMEPFRRKDSARINMLEHVLIGEVRTLCPDHAVTN